jgi:hypothetical protein
LLNITQKRNGIMKKPYFLIFIIPLVIIGCVQPESTVSALGGNNPPIIESVLVDPPMISVGTFAQIKVIASDPDGDQLKYSWFTILGDIIGSGSEVRYSAAYCCVGSNTVTITVTDSQGAKVSKDISIEIIL